MNEIKEIRAPAEIAGSEYRSNWKNVLVEPGQIQDIRYGGEGIIELVADKKTHELGGFAGQKILRMTKSYKRDLDIAENRRAVEEHILQTLQSRKDPLILRLWEPDQKYKSVVGNDYIPIDSAELKLVACETLDSDGLKWEMGETVPLYYVRGYDRTTIVLAEQKAIQVGDFVRGGIRILNNELGARAIRVQSFVERLQCKNGVTSRRFGHEFSKIHLGGKDGILNQFRGAVKEISSNKWDLVEAIKETISINLTKEEKEQIVAIHQQDGLISLNTATKLVKILQSGEYASGSPTLYGLLNAYAGLATHGVAWTVRNQLEIIIEDRLLQAKNKEQLLG